MNTHLYKSTQLPSKKKGCQGTIILWTVCTLHIKNALMKTRLSHFTQQAAFLFIVHIVNMLTAELCTSTCQIHKYIITPITPQQNKTKKKYRGGRLDTKRMQLVSPVTWLEYFSAKAAIFFLQLAAFLIILNSAIMTAAKKGNAATWYLKTWMQQENHRRQAQKRLV